MQKKILTPSDVGLLIPHWYDISTSKISRINRVCTRQSREGFGSKSTVMNVPAILADSEGYILNGRHRAYWAAKYGYSLEACFISKPNEIMFHVPRETFGSLKIEELVESLENKQTYISICNRAGIFSINDLVAKYV